jgi:hypothetical protein
MYRHLMTGKQKSGFQNIKDFYEFHYAFLFTFFSNCIQYRFCDLTKVFLLRYIQFLHDYLFSKLHIKHSVVVMV